MFEFSSKNVTKLLRIPVLPVSISIFTSEVISVSLIPAANPLVNTAILGAFARATGLVSIDAIKKAIEEYVPRAKEANMKAAQEAFEQLVSE